MATTRSSSRAASRASSRAASPPPTRSPPPQSLAGRLRGLSQLPTRACKALAAMPIKQEIVLRAGRDVEPNVRAQNLEACLAQAVGSAPPAVCASCVRGAGPFTTCQVVDGQLRGSCANCHYGSEGARCSLRPTAAPAAASPATPRKKRKLSRSAAEAPAAGNRKRTKALRKIARKMRELVNELEEMVEEMESSESDSE